MMMSYGLFVFCLKTLPYQKMTISKNWRYPKNERVNYRPALQYTGPSNDTITLSGSVYTEITNGRVSLEVLERMALLGISWPLIEGDGVPLGFFVLENVERTHSELNRDGSPRKIDFTLKLIKTDIPNPFENENVKDVIDIIDIII